MHDFDRCLAHNAELSSEDTRNRFVLSARFKLAASLALGIICGVVVMSIYQAHATTLEMNADTINDVDVVINPKNGKCSGGTNDKYGNWQLKTGHCGQELEGFKCYNASESFYRIQSSLEAAIGVCKLNPKKECYIATPTTQGGVVNTARTRSM